MGVMEIAKVKLQILIYIRPHSAETYIYRFMLVQDSRGGNHD